jgi:hypothetical protein
MPFGLWKSRWELLLEEMNRRDSTWREERAVADADWHDYCTRKEAEFAETMRKSDERWDEFILRSEERHAELLDRLDKNHRETLAGLKIAIDELRALRREVRETTDAVEALTEAVLRLIDRFDEYEGRPPGSGRMGPRSV